jgi:multidrug efflux pump subunit AcrB
MDDSDWGSMFKPIAVVFITVMLIALVETKLILPSHLAQPFLGRAGDFLAPVHEMSGSALSWFVKRVYVPSIRLCVRHCYVALAVLFGGLVLIIAAYFGGRINTVFFPRVASERIECRLTMLDGTPFEVTDQQIERIYQIADQMRKEYVGPDGQSVIRHIMSTSGASMSFSRGTPRGTGSHYGSVIMEPGVAPAHR